MKNIIALKVIMCGVLGIAALFGFYYTRDGWAIGIMMVAALWATVTIRDRDYQTEPVTADEARVKEVQILVDHLESMEHEDGDCNPCPVPELLKHLHA